MLFKYRYYCYFFEQKKLNANYFKSYKNILNITYNYICSENY